MKIAVSATSNDLNSQIDPRFGRCQFFIIIDPVSMEFETIKNESMNAMGGAGIQAAQNVANKNATVVLTGNMGPNAFQTLSAAGVKVVTGVTGNVKKAVELYMAGKLKESPAPNVLSHAGMGGGGMGSGGKRGGGQRGGRSGGRGGIQKLD